uniref:Uncharacterized protein LOC114344016 n=1 Tax=Diabrotica virgifera virgifera TaxID=50390 RepID=A0A6P7GX72_DIAVI
MYHKMMHVYQNDTRPSFGQLYFLDSGRANDIRSANTIFTAEMSAELIAQLDKFIRKVNPYAGLYCNMKEVHEKARTNAARNNATVPEISLVWFDDSGIDRRVYNRPTASEEIGAIFISGNGEIPKNIELQLYLRPEVAENQTDSRLLTISHLSPLADQLNYVLLYPTGGRGWCKNISLIHQSATRKRVTLRAFYAYRFMVRDTFNPLLESAKLTQQYIVNCYTKIESNNMDYLRINQNKLMVTNYSGLQDYLAQYESNCNVRVGPNYSTLHLLRRVSHRKKIFSVHDVIT